MKEKEIFYGYVPSVLDGTETELSGEKFESMPIPDKYSYQRFMPEVLDQGTESTCVPHSFTAVYDYYNAVKHPETYENGKFDHVEMSIDQVYRCRTNRGEGMSFKEALTFCRDHGVVTKEEYRKKDFSNPFKILDFAKISSLEILKRSLIINGPCLIATYVKDPNRPDFWNGYKNLGGHATCVVGYDNEKGILIRNSWGKHWGERGYSWMPYDQFKNVLEAWAVIV